MALPDDVLVLQKQVANFPTRTQVEALVSALGTDHTTLTAALNDAVADIALLLTEIQSLKDQIADIEVRLTALE